MALKQNKDGYVLTMTVHPDEVPDALLRDYVGARYQVVMVRLADDDTPMDRREFEGHRAVRLAGVLCHGRRSSGEFPSSQAMRSLMPNEDEATNWLRANISRHQLTRRSSRPTQEARQRLIQT
jgi:hypothetical protein